jgi:hypothetical protein
MPSPANITQIPAPRVEFIDPRTGLMAREWYRFFLNLFTLTGGGTNVGSLTDLQLGPPVQNQQVDIDAALDAAQLGYGSAVSIDQIAEMMKRVEALEAAPLPQPFHRRPAYGSFYDTTTQTAAVINTAYAMTFNTTDLTFGVTIGTPTSRVYVDTQGVYNIQFSAQLDKTTATVGLIYIWLRVNGTDVANSATQIRIQGNNAETVAAWNFLADLKAGDYFELMWSVDDITIQLLASGAVAPVPGIPSIILTVSDNISA